MVVNQNGYFRFASGLNSLHNTQRGVYLFDSKKTQRHPKPHISNRDGRSGDGADDSFGGNLGAG